MTTPDETAATEPARGRSRWFSVRANQPEHAHPSDQAKALWRSRSLCKNEHGSVPRDTVPRWLRSHIPEDWVAGRYRRWMRRPAFRAYEGSASVVAGDHRKGWPVSEMTWPSRSPRSG